MSKRAAAVQLTSDNADEENDTGEDVSGPIIVVVPWNVCVGGCALFGFLTVGRHIRSSLSRRDKD